MRRPPLHGQHAERREGPGPPARRRAAASSRPLADKDDLAGEAKLFCRGPEIADPDEWERVRKTFLDLRGFDMGDFGGSHLFTYDIEGAAWQRVEGDDWRTTSWRAGEPVRERVRNGALGESHDL